MCVCGFDMEVSTCQAIPKVKSCVEEGTFLAEHKDVNLMKGVVTVEVFNETRKDMGLCTQDIVDIPPPDSFYFVQGLQELLFEFSLDAYTEVVHS